MHLVACTGREKTMTILPSVVAGPENKGLAIDNIPVETFQNFAKRNATSPEIGPIRTCYDKGAETYPNTERFVFGLQGCDRICAAATMVMYGVDQPVGERVLKLDSVVVDPAFRQRGLAAYLVTEIFSSFLARADYGIKRIFAHSVHPATVQMLRRLGFEDPAPTGSPISHAEFAAETRQQRAVELQQKIKDQRGYMRLQCELCLKRSPRSRPWCKPRR
jgi:N-acetylglutamate synthase-like GNAT family acetyltransferase